MRKDNWAKYGPIVWEENTVIHIIQGKEHWMSVQARGFQLIYLYLMSKIAFPRTCLDQNIFIFD